jgi:UDP-N-acetylglucosamine--N-acetylmuramyl-(pentapeptide) pyrophosphoryl-undecaprenol N-acetylglucosamine transferase
MKRVLIAAGGTGGHIYPALALAHQLSENDDIAVAFAGGNLTQNRYFDSADYPVYTTSCGAFTSKNPLKIIRSFGKIGWGLWQSHQHLRAFKPDLAVGFGSYYTFPILIAALLRKVPVILHESNSIPGKVNRLLSPYAVVTGIHFPETALQLKGETTVVGMPLRPGFKKGSVTPVEARAYFQLTSEKPILLVFGGSQGANLINRAVVEALCTPFGQRLQVIHIAGGTEGAKILRYRYREWGISACVKEFETRMDLAWQAADLMISRAGAGTISEAIEFEIPGLLIPFAKAADNHQEKNADFMVNTVGGAEKILECDLDGIRLMRQLEGWLNDKYRAKREQIVAYKKRAPQGDLISLIKKNL